MKTKKEKPANPLQKLQEALDRLQAKIAAAKPGEIITKCPGKHIE